MSDHERVKSGLSRPLAAWACFLFYVVFALLNWRPSAIGTILSLIPFSFGLFLAVSSLRSKSTRVAGLLWLAIYSVMLAGMIFKSWSTFWRFRF